MSAVKDIIAHDFEQIDQLLDQVYKENQKKIDSLAWDVGYNNRQIEDLMRQIGLIMCENESLIKEMQKVY
jgi:hypothetical protein